MNGYTRWYRGRGVVDLVYIIFQRGSEIVAKLFKVRHCIVGIWWWTVPNKASSSDWPVLLCVRHTPYLTIYTTKNVTHRNGKKLCQENETINIMCLIHSQDSVITHWYEKQQIRSYPTPWINSVCNIAMWNFHHIFAKIDPIDSFGMESMRFHCWNKPLKLKMFDVGVMTTSHPPAIYLMVTDWLSA